MEIDICYKENNISILFQLKRMNSERNQESSPIQKSFKKAGHDGSCLQSQLLEISV
jgi:hypothetical protein